MQIEFNVRNHKRLALSFLGWHLRHIDLDFALIFFEEFARVKVPDRGVVVVGNHVNQMAILAVLALHRLNLLLAIADSGVLLEWHDHTRLSFLLLDRYSLVLEIVRSVYTLSCSWLVDCGELGPRADLSLVDFLLKGREWLAHRLGTLQVFVGAESRTGGWLLPLVNR